jgi:hypothetical protein
MGAYEAEWAAFVAAVKSGGQVPVTLADGVAALWLRRSRNPLRSQRSKRGSGHRDGLSPKGRESSFPSRQTVGPQPLAKGGSNTHGPGARESEK